jgi:hypothetical protein
MFRFKALIPDTLAGCAGDLLTSDHANSQDHAGGHGVVPLRKMPSERWVEKVWGDTEKPGGLFVIRIRNDPGYIMFPHTHPMDENIICNFNSLGLGPS